MHERWIQRFKGPKVSRDWRDLRQSRVQADQRDVTGRRLMVVSAVWRSVQTHGPQRSARRQEQRGCWVCIHEGKDEVLEMQGGQSLQSLWMKKKCSFKAQLQRAEGELSHQLANIEKLYYKKLDTEIGGKECFRGEKLWSYYCQKSNNNKTKPSRILERKATEKKSHSFSD